jgi:hypothetical protein
VLSTLAQAVIMINNGVGRRGDLRSVLAGARSGVVATLSMTAGYELLKAAGWMDELPPRQIAKRLLPDGTSKGVVNATASIAHLGYGAVTGALYAFGFRSPGAVTGILYGVAVGLASYEGWVPLVRLRHPMHRDHPRAIAAMTIGHVIFGLELGRRLNKNQPKG